MRKRFEQDKSLDSVPIEEVYIDKKSRDGLPQLLGGLLHIFVTPDLNAAIFEILEKRVKGDKKNTGRPGMSLWELFVMGLVRLNLNIDYDRLHDMANNHDGMRVLMGIQTRGVFERGKQYNLQTIKDNVGLLDETTLIKINEVVVLSLIHI